MKRRRLHSPLLPYRRQIAVCLAVVAAPLALLGCGSDEGSGDLEGEPFSEQESRDFTENLDEIDGLVTAGDCEGAESKLTALIGAVEGVPAERDEGLKTDLVTALEDLDGQISDQCVDGDSEPETSSTTSTTTEEETESVPTTTDDEPEETSTTSSSTTEEPDPPDEDPAPPADPPGNGTPPVDPGNSGDDDDSGGVTPGFEADRRPAGGGR